jgi:ATP-dependent DNA ligase
VPAPKIAGVTFPIQPVKPVTATSLPSGKPGDWSYEPKFDGFRCIAFRSTDRVQLQSRQQRSLTRYFPEISAAVASLDVAAVLDGELVLWHRGKLDFGALQQRLHPANSRASFLARTLPSSYVVFDVLAIDAADMRSRPYIERRACLEDLLSRQLPHGLVLMPMSTDPAVAQQWLMNHSAAGIEGVVAKRTRQAYRAGKTKWQKVRTRVTAEAVVGGVLGTLAKPDALVVGLPDPSGRLRIAGRTGSLAPPVQHALSLALTAAGGAHPWPEVIPSSRFGQRPSKPVEYTRVVPSLVVELDVDVAFEQYRWRHAARLVRVRRDLTLADLQRAGYTAKHGP